MNDSRFGYKLRPRKNKINYYALNLVGKKTELLTPKTKKKK